MKRPVAPHLSDPLKSSNPAVRLRMAAAQWGKGLSEEPIDYTDSRSLNRWNDLAEAAMAYVDHACATGKKAPR